MLTSELSSTTGSKDEFRETLTPRLGPQRPSTTVVAQGSRIRDDFGHALVGLSAGQVPLTLAIAWQTDNGIPITGCQPLAASAQITVQIMPSSLLAGTQLY